MNKFEARLHFGAALRELLLEMLDDDLTDAEYLELESDLTELVLALLDELEVEVLDVAAPFATLRVRVDAALAPEVSPEG